MVMHNPPHPGEFIRSVYLEPFSMSARALADSLAVSPSTLNRVITGKSGISPDMALRLSKALGRSAESWLAMQVHYDLWQAKNMQNSIMFSTLNMRLHNKAFKLVPALRASTGPKKSAPFWAA